MVGKMLKKLLSSVIALAALAGFFAAPAMAYPERPDDATVQYQLYAIGARVPSMLTSWFWDIPTAAFQDSVKGAIGGTKMVARNLGKEDGMYEKVAGAMVGGPVGYVAGAGYGVLHGFGYGTVHGFMGYPNDEHGCRTAWFQGRQYVVPYDDNY
jgi:hypothetical protein